MDGTHKVVLETNSSKFHLSLERGGQNGKPLLLKIQSATRACGCILAEAKRGTTDRAWLDRFKLRHMQIRDGDSVDIEPTQFVEAQRIELQVPTGFLE
ncbi:MAG: hypothetical protein Q7R34_15840, partial [Dehalococcoidia bacterium]|nr:hypothetical protein [Dehalococcoidia bacterium]